MLASFKKLVKDESYSLSIPKEILDAMNLRIPISANAEYVDHGNGVCILTPKPPYNNFVIEIIDSEILNQIPNDIKSAQELIDYMYRTQTTIHCKGGCKAIFNGFEINLSEVTQYPFQEIKPGEMSEFYISPEQFKAVKPITVTAAGYSIELDAKRIPEREKNLIVISAGESFWLKIKLVINTDTETLKTNATIQFNYSKCKTVNEFVIAMKMYNGLICGDYTISCLNGTLPLISRELVKEEYIAFWEKVGKLESILKVSFTPNISLIMSEVHELNQLFRSLLENKPFASTIKQGPNVGLNLTEINDLDKRIGDNIVFTFTQEVTWNLLGTKFKTLNLCCILNADVVSIKKDDSSSETPFFVQLMPTKEKEMLLVTQIFLNHEAVKAFQTSFGSYTGFTDSFSQAEKIEIELEYLDSIIDDK